MILDAEERQCAMAHAFIRVVVEIHMRDFHVARRERIRVHAEAVVLGSDFDFFRGEILDGMIRAMVAKF